MDQYINCAFLLVFSSSPHHLTLWPLQKIRLMRLGINMLSHPPQPFIIVCMCACVCVFTDRSQRARERDNERGCATTLTHLHYTITQTHTVCACLNASMNLHTSTNRYTNKHWLMYVNGNVTELVCTTHTSGVSSISNPCETVDYSCKFSCLQTAFAMSFYLLQLNVNHYLVYSCFQRDVCELFSSTQSCRLGLGWQLTVTWQVIWKPFDGIHFHW